MKTKLLVLVSVLFVCVGVVALTHTTIAQQKISDDRSWDLPVGTILLWAGDPDELKKHPRWHICDGGNDTVNLVDHIPMGQSSGKVPLGDLHTLSGPNTGPTVPPEPDGSKKWDGGPESYPAQVKHTHPLPIARVYFVQNTGKD
jgi:hypothetical protein